MFDMRRRQFITLLGGATVAWPLAARGQQPAMPVIGLLGGGSPESFAPLLASLRQGLQEAGVVDGRNTVIEPRWARGEFDRLPGLAADLVEGRLGLAADRITHAENNGVPGLRPALAQRAAEFARPNDCDVHCPGRLTFPGH